MELDVGDKTYCWSSLLDPFAFSSTHFKMNACAYIAERKLRRCHNTRMRRTRTRGPSTRRVGQLSVGQSPFRPMRDTLPSLIETVDADIVTGDDGEMDFKCSSDMPPAILDSTTTAQTTSGYSNALAVERGSPGLPSCFSRRMFWVPNIVYASSQHADERCTVI